MGWEHQYKELPRMLLNKLFRGHIIIITTTTTTTTTLIIIMKTIIIITIIVKIILKKAIYKNIKAIRKI